MDSLKTLLVVSLCASLLACAATPAQDAEKPEAPATETQHASVTPKSSNSATNNSAKGCQEQPKVGSRLKHKACDPARQSSAPVSVQTQEHR